MPPKKKVEPSAIKGASASVNTRRSAAGGNGKSEPAAPSAAVEPTAPHRVTRRSASATAGKGKSATAAPSAAVEPTAPHRVTRSSASATAGKGKSATAAPSAAVEPTAVNKRKSTAVNKRKSTAAASKAEAATKPPPIGNVDKVPVPEKRVRGRPPKVPQVPKQQSLDEETADTEEDEEELRVPTSSDEETSDPKDDEEELPVPTSPDEETSDPKEDEEELPVPREREAQVAEVLPSSTSLVELKAQVAEVLPSSTSLVELKVQKKRGRPRKLKQPTSPKKRGRKRKQVDAQAGEGQPKPGTGSIYQCQPVAYVKDVVQKLMKNPKAVQLIEKIDWDIVLEVGAFKLNKQVVKLMVDCFDTVERKLTLNPEHGPIDIKPLVQKIVGAPNDGSEVNRTEGHDDSDLYELLKISGGHSAAAPKSFKLLEDALEAVEDNKNNEQELQKKEREFCILFILQTFAYYLGPRSNRNMERSLLKFFNGKSMADLKNMKWCDLIADELIEGIIEFKKSGVINKKMHGCAAILMVIFYDFVTENTTDAKFPRANHLSNEDFRKFSKMSEKDLLDLVRKARPLNETVYKNAYEVLRTTRGRITEATDAEDH